MHTSLYIQNNWSSQNNAVSFYDRVLRRAVGVIYECAIDGLPLLLNSFLPDFLYAPIDACISLLDGLLRNRDRDLRKFFSFPSYSGYTA